MGPTIEKVDGTPPGRLRKLIGLAALVLLASFSGCGTAETVSSSDATVPERDAASVADATVEADADLQALRPPPCPAGSPNCEQASGEIAYVERVDPDGDGDAHFVLVSLESITGPGVSVIDVRADLRPRPLPGPGDQLAASGPVYEGHLGQRQIQAGAVRSRITGPPGP